MQTKTISQLLNKLPPNFDRREAEILLAKIFKKDRYYVLAHPEKTVSVFKQWQLGRLISQRLRHVPLAYLLGHKEFFGLDFLVNKDVLIPRPETELLVEKVLEKINTTLEKPITLIDVGTGSGCIPISLTKNTGLNLEIIALDISTKALKVAQKNSKIHQTNITFLKSDLLGNLPEIVWDKKNLIITANLPYLNQTEFETETSIQSEPELALVAKQDGKALMEKLLEQIQTKIKPGHKIELFLEMNPHQITSIQNFTKQLFFCQVVIIPDLAGLNRVVCLSLSPKN